ncbi:MAG: HDIG domain-containing protein [Desulforegulaceae bacterium]|nr:HDIG domain-containing protein [Desulforegulaceae bacterium]
MNDSYIPTRKEALELLKEYTKTEGLIKHALAVEGTMKHFALKFGEDPEKWGIIGLIHDLDYEKWPDEHCKKTKEILEENNWPKDYIRAVMSHGYGICTDVEPVHKMEKVLYAIDELTGLINASALVRPSKSILDIKLKSVKKKWKDKSFAAGVNRSTIEKGAKMLEIDLGELMSETIEAMKTIADEIGLKGNL